MHYFFELFISCSKVENNDIELCVKNSSDNIYHIPLNEALSNADKILSILDENDSINTKTSGRTVKNISYKTFNKFKSKSANMGIPDTLLYIVNYDNNKGFAIL